MDKGWVINPLSLTDLHYAVSSGAATGSPNVFYTDTVGVVAIGTVDPFCVDCLWGYFMGIILERGLFNLGPIRV
jgi:hypothetical protein